MYARVQQKLTRASQVAQWEEEQETQETEVQVLGQEDPLEKELATTPETSTAL